MNEKTPDQANTHELALDQLRILGKLFNCLDAAGYHPKDTQQLHLMLAAHNLHPQPGRPAPGPEEADRAASLEEALPDRLDTAGLIERSSLGTPSARQIRNLTSVAQIAEILRRRDQRLATCGEQSPADPAKTGITETGPAAELSTEDFRPAADTHPRGRAGEAVVAARQQTEQIVANVRKENDKTLEQAPNMPREALHAVILAGGKGVRLRPYTTRLPKPLIPIGEEHTILEIMLQQLARCGFSRVTLAVGHFGQLIRAYIGDGSQWGVQIDYTEPEEVPLGTIGPVLRILDRLPEQFLVINGDVLTDIDLADLMRSHRESGAPLTVATYERQVRIDYGVLTTRDQTVVDFAEKPTIEYRVSMGVYAFSRHALARYTPGLPFGFDELVLDMLARGVPPREYHFQGYWFDVGRPDDYERVNAEFGLLRGSLLKDPLPAGDPASRRFQKA